MLLPRRTSTMAARPRPACLQRAALAATRLQPAPHLRQRAARSLPALVNAAWFDGDLIDAASACTILVGVVGGASAVASVVKDVRHQTQALKDLAAGQTALNSELLGGQAALNSELLAGQAALKSELLEALNAAESRMALAQTAAENREEQTRQELLDAIAAAESRLAQAQAQAEQRATEAQAQAEQQASAAQAQAAAAQRELIALVREAKAAIATERGSNVLSARQLHASRQQQVRRAGGGRWEVAWRPHAPASRLVRGFPCCTPGPCMPPCLPGHHLYRTQMQAMRAPALPFLAHAGGGGGGKRLLTAEAQQPPVGPQVRRAGGPAGEASLQCHCKSTQPSYMLAAPHMPLSMCGFPASCAAQQGRLQPYRCSTPVASGMTPRPVGPPYLSMRMLQAAEASSLLAHPPQLR